MTAEEPQENTLTVERRGIYVPIAFCEGCSNGILNVPIVDVDGTWLSKPDSEADGGKFEAIVQLEGGDRHGRCGDDVVDVFKAARILLLYKWLASRLTYLMVLPDAACRREGPVAVTVTLPADKSGAAQSANPLGAATTTWQAALSPRASSE